MFSGLALRRRKTAALSVKASNAMATLPAGRDGAGRDGEIEEEEESVFFAVICARAGWVCAGEICGEVGGGVWRASRWGMGYIGGSSTVRLTARGRRRSRLACFA